MSTFHTSASSPHNPLRILLSQNTTTFYFPLPTADTEEGLRAWRQGGPPAPPCPRLPPDLHLGCSSTRARWRARLQELRCFPESLQSRARLVRGSEMICPEWRTPGKHGVLHCHYCPQRCPASASPPSSCPNPTLPARKTLLLFTGRPVRAIALSLRDKACPFAHMCKANGISEPFAHQQLLLQVAHAPSVTWPVW